MKRLLLLLDSDPVPNAYDIIVGYDGGADHIVSYGGITPDNVGTLIDGAVFTRGLSEKKHTAVFIGAGFAWGGNIALGHIATILAIYTAYVRAAGKIAGAPNEFCGPMAKQHRMLVITLIGLYSAVTPSSWQAISFNSSKIGLMSLGLAVIIMGSIITVIRRLARIARVLK